MKLKLFEQTSLKCLLCGHGVCATNVRGVGVNAFYKCTSCGAWFERTVNNSLIRLDYSYTPCYGTHGNPESKEEICDKCLQFVKE